MRLYVCSAACGSHLARRAGADHVGVREEALGDAAAAKGAGGRGHGAVAGLV